MGIDVSKDILDVYRPDTGENMKIQNTEVDINGLCKVLKKKNVLVAMEATGGYETRLVKCLAKHGIDAAVLNPRQVRDFAKGIGLDAKTDPIDAQVISKFASVVKPQAMPIASDHEQKHSALVARRCQLLAPINRDSGKKTGKRFIGGGRGQVRRVLYMATLVAIRHNPAIKAFYVHLTSKRKESKVAIVAWLRKLITILNLLIKADQLWITKRAF